MASLSYNIEAEIIRAFNSTPRYLDELININNLFFEGKMSQIYAPELMFLIPKPYFFIYIYLF